MNGVLVLNENIRFPDRTGAGYLRDKCVFTSRDMGADWPEAFVYGVVVGWDEGMSEIAGRHEWDAELIAFVKDAHERFTKLAEKVEP